MAGFSGFDPVIRRLGGIASRRELRRAGWVETELWFAWSYGNLDRIRIGWYASSDLPADARAAWKAGGPLACESALAHYGMLDQGVPAGLVVHWSTPDRYSGSRRAVSPAVAQRQARTCARRRTRRENGP